MANRVLEPEVAAHLRTIGKQMAEVRKQQRVTQADVAAKSGIDTKNLRKYENGQINATIEQLLRIARGLNADLKVEFVLRDPSEADKST